MYDAFERRRQLPEIPQLETGGSKMDTFSIVQLLATNHIILAYWRLPGALSPHCSYLPDSTSDV